MFLNKMLIFVLIVLMQWVPETSMANSPHRSGGTCQSKELVCAPPVASKSISEEPQSGGKTFREKKIDEENLIAQKQIAVASTDQAKYAFVGEVVATINIFIVSYALFASRKANQISSQALAISNGALDHAKETAKNGSRAYVYLESLKSGRALNPDGTYAGIKFQVLWKNYGSTPALNVKCHTTSMDWHTGALPPWFPFPELEHPLAGLSYQVVSQIAPGASKSQNLPRLRDIPKLIGEVSKGWRRIFVWGIIEYDDIFGVHHKTTFCQISSGAGFKDGDTESPEIVFSEYHLHNKSDAECLLEESKRPSMPEDVASMVTSPNGWADWLESQAPSTYERAPDGTPVDSRRRDYFGVLQNVS